ncbi:hypothetical protein CYMTET_45877 [Cymbomonas tetramitiformis]|uniref:Uncharacterized protein n=1 Tax=Cymbomonas tetramitiformis TaxID=36881 RepID=A0AAE0BXB5_9CHLO|nr:hypothetical protein CYMTET_45877 [Cymbomonas tetramitiformis]
MAAKVATLNQILMAVEMTDSIGEDRMQFLWLTILPFALYKDCGWSAVPIEAFSAFCLLGIEDIGVQIEEPFSVLSCEGICGSVTANCTAMLEEDEKDRALIKAAKLLPAK